LSRTGARLLRRKDMRVVALGLAIAAALFFTWLLFQAPADFPRNTAIEIEEGMETAEIISLLEEERAVRFGFMLQLFLIFAHHNEYVQANTYLFPEKLTVSEVARAITRGEHIAPPLKITIPEGLTGLYDQLPAKSTPDLHAGLFDTHIGYLFPDTYYLSHDFTQEDLIALMRQTFDDRMKEYEEQVTASGLSIEEIVTLASIVEREAGDGETKPLVAGVLLNRLAIDMPLQVDAVFYFILGKTSAELTRADLRMDSPFNTYTNKGLPPTPIANPGLDSIKAVLEPIESDYYYYLTAPDGTFHYAATHDEHVNNKARYLP
jgi:UPF0755 protein